METYSHIELTEEEKELALRQAREQKYFLLKRLEYSERLFQEDQPLRFTADQMIESYGRHFDIDQDNREIVEQIAYYFAEDPRFTGDHMRGILLYGAVGVGKSELMRFFSRNQKQSFILVPCRHVEVAYAKDGDEGIGIHCCVRLRSAGSTDPYGKTEVGTCFDDLGTEPIVTKYYGTDKSVMTEVILNRYDMQMAFNQTHITTNLSADQLRERYGTRAVDRMREMFNFISWSSTRSRRGKDTTPNP